MLLTRFEFQCLSRWSIYLVYLFHEGFTGAYQLQLIFILGRLSFNKSIIHEPHQCPSFSQFSEDKWGQKAEELSSFTKPHDDEPTDALQCYTSTEYAMFTRFLLQPDRVSHSRHRHEGKMLLMLCAASSRQWTRWLLSRKSLCLIFLSQARFVY